MSSSSARCVVRPAAFAWCLLVALALTLIAPPSRAATDQSTAYLSGQLLVAAPSMPDPRFAGTVIYMVRHDATGAMGVVVNRPMGEIAMRDLLEALGVERDGVEGKVSLHFGGPVEYNLGFVLHSADFLAEGSLVVDDRVAMSAPVDVADAMAAGKGPRRSLFLFGYAGWAPGQLEAELARDDWLAVPADESLLFGGNDAAKWDHAMAKLSVDL